MSIEMQFESAKKHNAASYFSPGTNVSSRPGTIESLPQIKKRGVSERKQSVYNPNDEFIATSNINTAEATEAAERFDRTLQKVGLNPLR